MRKCKQCGKETISLNLFRFDYKTYEWLTKTKQGKVINPKMNEMLKALNNKMVCQSCLNKLTHDLRLNYYQSEKVEFIGVSDCYNPGFKNFNEHN